MTAATRTNTTPATEPTVVCKFCGEQWSIVHQFVQVQSRFVTVSATGELTDEMIVECPDGDDDAGSDEWYCRECNTRSTNRDTVAVVVEVPSPFVDEDRVSDEELAQLRSDPRDHGDGCNANCWCWS